MADARQGWIRAANLRPRITVPEHDQMTARELTRWAGTLHPDSKICVTVEGGETRAVSFEHDEGAVVIWAWRETDTDGEEES